MKTTQPTGLTITLTLTSLAQVAAVQNALDLLVDMENDRSKGDPDWSKKDAAQLAAARQVIALLGGQS